MRQSGDCCDSDGGGDGGGDGLFEKGKGTEG